MSLSITSNVRGKKIHYFHKCLQKAISDNGCWLALFYYYLVTLILKY